MHACASLDARCSLFRAKQGNVQHATCNMQRAILVRRSPNRLTTNHHYRRHVTTMAPSWMRRRPPPLPTTTATTTPSGAQAPGIFFSSSTNLLFRLRAVTTLPPLPPTTSPSLRYVFTYFFFSTNYYLNYVLYEGNLGNDDAATTDSGDDEVEWARDPSVSQASGLFFLILRSYFTNSYYLQVFYNDLHDAGYQWHRGKKEKGGRRKQQGKKKKGARDASGLEPLVSLKNPVLVLVLVVYWYISI